MTTQKVLFRDLGTMDYQPAWDLQEELLAENVRIKSAKWNAKESGPAVATDEETAHHLLFVEHPPVYTLGKSGKMDHVLISDEDRQKNNLGFYKINRGGDITFHGPGQIVAYPIFDLEKFYTDIGRYMRSLEEVVIRTCADYSIQAGRSAGETGVWIDAGKRGWERKICAIGVRCSRWITMHGFAFNVNTNLDYFNNIIPCGIQDKQVTSLAKELKREMDIEEVKQKVKANFEKVFEVRFIEDDFERGL
jgi:lipoyl(octanoyl) transferase